ncbi:DUF6879 family protein [Polymorphospora sp. NPDC050346]|uniref:DUF6879 family protein n=1 Tax=Polymorphospora sp. NPDC050346 TaxID=3155780 RepID=UPI0033CCCC35
MRAQVGSLAQEGDWRRMMREQGAHRSPKRADVANGDRALTVEEFSLLFESCESSAFRFEAQSFYRSNVETVALAQFLNGEQVDLEWLQEWLSVVRGLTRGGRVMQRVRIIGDPPSSYLRFSLFITPHLIAAGDDIRYLSEVRADSLGIELQDFWLFDNKRVAAFSFDRSGDLEGITLIQDEMRVEKYIKLRSILMDNSLTFKEYRANHLPQLG